jgi:ABC-type antimicrobial peptide transport system permease subunit
VFYVPLTQNFSDAMTLFVRSAKGTPAGHQTGEEPTSYSGGTLYPVPVLREFGRSKRAPGQIMLSVQKQMREIGPQIMIDDIRTGRTIIDNGLLGARVGVGLLSVFGLLALSLASIGLYGAMAYAANLRKRETELRMALGAARGNILRLMLGQGMRLVVTGVLIGFVAALIVGRLLSRLLYGVSAADPLSVAATAIILLLVALLACYLPARCASRVDPLVALREG